MYEEFLSEFLKIPKKQKIEESFISICGFPHREKVSSNILAFFLDTNREHNLGDLFVRSLLEAAELNPNDFPNDFVSETEFCTKKGNFIDIILRNDQMNIVIENKIFAWLYNDLNDYYTSGKEGKESLLGIVLSLYSQNNDNKNFKYITYEMFFEKIKKNIGYYIAQANKKYLPFLYDYLDNIENISRGEDMDKDFIEFVKNHEKDAIDFAGKIDDLRKNLRNIVKSVNQLLGEKLGEKIKEKKVKIWIWRELSTLFDDAVVDYYPDKDKNLNIALDSKIQLSGWRFELWIRKNNTGKEVKLETYIDKINEEGNIKGHRYVLNKTFSFDASIEEVSDFIASIVNKL